MGFVWLTCHQKFVQSSEGYPTQKHVNKSFSLSLSLSPSLPLSPPLSLPFSVSVLWWCSSSDPLSRSICKGLSSTFLVTNSIKSEMQNRPPHNCLRVRACASGAILTCYRPWWKTRVLTDFQSGPKDQQPALPRALQWSSRGTRSLDNRRSVLFRCQSLWTSSPASWCLRRWCQIWAEFEWLDRLER